MRIAAVFAVAFLGTLNLAIAQHANAAIQHYQLNIPRQSLDTALKDLAQQTGLQIGRFSGRIDGSAMVGPVKGDQTPEQALKTLLDKTGLNYKIVSDTMIAVYNPKDATSAQFNSPAPAEGRGRHGDEDSAGTQGGTQNKSFWDRFRLAETDQGSSASSPTIERQRERATGEQAVDLEEVVVTAQKRTENLLDVPVPVTAISAQALIESNQLRLQDYFTSIPGLGVVGGSSSSDLQTLSIRGITTGIGNPTVGIMIDDVPYGASTNAGGGGYVPDVDPNDLARVEVLRGPQGTLYGASSMGGLIKFVTVDPSTDGFTGRVQAGTSSVYNGAELGYNFRGSVNLPVSNTMAIRASAFTREDPGYIDNPVTGIEGVNKSVTSGGRLAALWKPSELFSLKLSALYQDSYGDGVSDATVGLGGLQQNYIRGTGQSEGKVEAYSATVTAKLGSVNLTSLTGYNKREDRGSFDFSSIFGGPAGYTQQRYGVPGAALVNEFPTNKFTQEIRLTAPIGRIADWLLGAFYTHEVSDAEQDIPAIDPATGLVVADGFRATNPTAYVEYAAFANLTLHPSERVDVQIGVRGSEIRETVEGSVAIIPLITDSSVPSIGQESRAKGSPVTYLLTPSFKLSPDLMVYARLASGYRAGGSNEAPTHEGLCGGFSSTAAFYPNPCQYNPDKTYNYELGAKGDLLDHVVSFDASVYYIAWKNIQLQAITPQTDGSYITNAGAAKSQGVELSTVVRPLTGLAIEAWATWNDAELTEGFPATVSAVYGFAGDRLPYGSRFSANVSVDEHFVLPHGVSGFVGVSESYVGDRTGPFTASASLARQYLPGYGRADLRAGVAYDTWMINLSLNNAFDKRGLNAFGQYAFPDLIYIQPRSIGLNAIKTF